MLKAKVRRCHYICVEDNDGREFFGEFIFADRKEAEEKAERMRRDIEWSIQKIMGKEFQKIGKE